jgi:SAM-dependent MidA family methyltransferase
MMSGLEQRLVERIRREGPVPFDVFVEEALYGDGGFFASGHGAGRAAADFVTSPEVGQLFGALVARYLDGVWDDLGRPDPFVVIEVGAGRGRLAADVLAATPACAPALRYVLVERSEALRQAQRELLTVEPFDEAFGPGRPDPDDPDDPRPVPVTGLGPIVSALDELPAVHVDGVVLANELLDNLPFRLVERAADGWLEVRVAHDGTRFVETLVPATDHLAAEADLVAAGDVPTGVRLPAPTGVGDWLRAVASVLRHGRVLLVDYAAAGAELAARGQGGWLRTFRAHERGAAPLDGPGTQDITADVPLEFTLHAATRAGFTLRTDSTQAEWLRALGLDDLVATARDAWDARAHVADLEALRWRSRVSEGAALTDPSGLGAHRVVELTRGTSTRAPG